jgi:ribosome-binding protein aMBF1 (putative translation factor)
MDILTSAAIPLIESMDVMMESVQTMTRANIKTDIGDGFGLVMRQKRRQRGFSLADLGRATKMHPTYLGLIERGENLPTILTVFRIADALGVPPADLVREADDYRRSFRKV